MADETETHTPSSEGITVPEHTHPAFREDIDSLRNDLQELSRTVYERNFAAAEHTHEDIAGRIQALESEIMELRVRAAGAEERANEAAEAAAQQANTAGAEVVETVHTETTPPPRKPRAGFSFGKGRR